MHAEPYRPLRSPVGAGPLLSRRAMLGASATLAGQCLLPTAVLAQSLPAATAMVAAINTADTATIATWARRHVSPAGLERRGPDAWGRLLADTAADSGRWTIDRVEAVGSAQRLYVRAARLDGVRRLDVRTDREDGTKVFDLRPVFEAMPYRGAIAPARSIGGFVDAMRHRVDHAIRHDDFSGTVRVTDAGGRPLVELAHGWADRAAGRRMTLDTPINLGSADKSFTALLIAQLVEAGRLSFDTPIATLLPDFTQRTGATDVTVRHLLTHRAGFGEPRGGILAYTRQPYARVSELLPQLATVPRDFSAGARTAYSNEGYVVLGAIIEQLTGGPYWDVLADGIYARAGMRRSAHLRRDQLSGRAAVGYCRDRDDLLQARPRQAVQVEAPWRGNACGGGYSTAGDMARYFTALRAGRIVSNEMLATLLTPSGHPYPDLTYGMGFVLETEGDAAFFGHSGGGVMVGIGAAARAATRSGWSIVVLGNYDVPYAESLLRDIERAVPISPSS